MWSKNFELRYWNVTGLEKGDHIYGNYYSSFKLDRYDLSGKTIVDIGCGPFGGVLCKFPKLNVIPMDILADEYNQMGVSDRDIIYGDLNETLPLEDKFCDIVICTNALDHTEDMLHGLKEIRRILKKAGLLFIHVHCRTRRERNKAHVHAVDNEICWNLFKKANFGIVDMSRESDWVNDRDDRQAIYCTLKKDKYNRIKNNRFRENKDKRKA